jgi:predicted nucleic acid-binding protein
VGAGRAERAPGGGRAPRRSRTLIHLDTGFLIGALRRGSREDQRLRGWLAKGEFVGMSVVTWTEFLCGPVEAAGIDLAARIIDEPEPLVAGDALVAARLFNLGGRRRGSLTDCMIAAVAIRVGAELATTNAADFRRFEPAGLTLVAVG